MGREARRNREAREVAARLAHLARDVQAVPGSAVGHVQRAPQGEFPLVFRGGFGRGDEVEGLGDDGRWHPLSDWKEGASDGRQEAE